ncbi:MAG: SGNH/GDSL hydrolase family protein [Actinomycetota bacterium]
MTIRFAARLARFLATGAALFGLVVGVEIFLAYRRDYLPTEPVLDIRGTFGPPGGDPLNLVVLGDSTAAGVGAGDVSNAYPVLLAQRLGEEHNRRVTLTSLGVSGARVRTVLTDQIPRVAATHPDLVFVAIGANDVTHVTRLDDVERDMTLLIDRLHDTGAAVVVAGPPDMRAAAFHEPLRTLVGWRGRKVAETIARAAARRDVPVVPLAERAGPYFAAHPEEAYGGDDFHPGPGGYAAWARAIYPYLEAALVSATRAR